MNEEKQNNAEVSPDALTAEMKWQLIAVFLCKFCVLH